MTYGYWLDRAREHLREAAGELASNDSASAIDVLAVAVGRRGLYRQLMRHVDLLVPPQSRGRRWPDAKRLAHALRDAADVGETPPPAPASSRSVRDMADASECLAVAADVLATHFGPGHWPRTPEGAAIRAGGGIPSALTAIARVGFDVVTIDLAVLDGLRSADGQHGEVIRQVAGELRRSTAGALPQVIRDIIAAAPIGTPLLHHLEAAPVTQPGSVTLAAVRDPGAALRLARNWLWQNPTRIHAIHLRLGTQVGLAITRLAGQDPADHTSGARTWRRTAAAARELEGGPPADEHRWVAGALGAVLRWAADTPHAVTPAEVEALRAQLPGLAQAMYDGVAAAIGRHDLYVNRPTLAAPNRRGIRQAVAAWQPAARNDREIKDLRASLGCLAGHPDEEDEVGRSLARAAFQRPPRPGTTPLPPPPAAIAAQTDRGRSRSR